MNARIGIIIGQLGWGGAERQVSLLAPGLAARGMEVSVICLSRELDPFGEKLRRAGMTVHAIERRGRREPGRALALARILRGGKIELAHSFLESAGIYAWLAGHMARRTVLLPSVRSLPSAESRLWHALTGRSLRSARLIIANSHSAAGVCSERYRVPRERFRVAPNGVELPPSAAPEERETAKRSFRLAENNMVLGTVSKDAPDKNVPAFLRLAGRLGRECGPLCSIAAGRGLDESYAARFQPLQRHSVCQSLFLGPLADVDRLYRCLDLFVLTSLRESLPNVLLEAMAHGLPCVAYSVGGAPEIIEHGVTGLLVEPGDEEGLFQAARSVLTDPERGRAMGQAGRRRVAERFSVEAMVESTCRVYEELLGN